LKISAVTGQTEQLNTAIDQLGSKELQVRLAGVLLLERAVKSVEEPQEKVIIQRILANYIRRDHLGRLDHLAPRKSSFD
jgi:hypothetical protein